MGREFLAQGLGFRVQLKMVSLDVHDVVGFSAWVGTSPTHDEKARLVHELLNPRP